MTGQRVIALLFVSACLLCGTQVTAASPENRADVASGLLAPLVPLIAVHKPNETPSYFGDIVTGLTGKPEWGEAALKRANERPGIRAAVLGFFAGRSDLIIVPADKISGIDVFELEGEDGQTLLAEPIGVDRVTNTAVLQLDIPTGRSLLNLSESPTFERGAALIGLSLKSEARKRINDAQRKEILGRGYIQASDFDPMETTTGKAGHDVDFAIKDTVPVYPMVLPYTPVADYAGNVLGISVATRVAQGGGTTFSFLARADRLLVALKEIMRTGSVLARRLGITYATTLGPLVVELGFDSNQAVQVARTAIDGPAERAGIGAGAVITHIDGEEIETKTLASVIESKSPNGSVEITYSWKNETKTVLVELRNETQ